MKKKTVAQLNEEIKALKKENMENHEKIQLLAEVSETQSYHKIELKEQIRSLDSIKNDYIEAFKHSRKIEMIKLESELENQRLIGNIFPPMLKLFVEYFTKKENKPATKPINAGPVNVKYPESYKTQEKIWPNNQ